MTGMARTLNLAARIAISVLLLLTPLAAQPQYTQATPWSYWVPMDINAPPKGDKAVILMAPNAGAPDVPIPGAYFKPVGTPRGAVVIVNSATGWTDAREGHFGRSLSSAGYAVLAIDSYGPRGVTGTLIDNARLSFFVQARDAYAARRYLVANGHAADRIAIMGTGRGGTVALLAADKSFLQDETERFNLAVAISPGCMLHPRAPKPGAGIFMAVADKDDISGVGPCRDLARDYAEAGGRVSVKTYAGASGSFDGHPAMTRRVREPFAETFLTCKVPVELDGRMVLGARQFFENDYAALIAEMRKACMGKSGTAWTNLTQKANVTLDVIAFLDASFRR